WLAGRRVDPAPSDAFASGTMPEATAAADPPEDPPAVRVRSQGLRVGPKASGSEVKESANSGVFDFPRITRPAALYRAVMVESRVLTTPRSSSEPEDKSIPSASKPVFFKSIGTPARALPAGNAPGIV